MSIFKHIVISIIFAVLAFITVYSGYTIYAADNKDDTIYAFEGVSDYLVIVNSYHQEMNELFNNKTGYLVELMENDADFMNHPDFVTPDNKEGCGENNVSTYCVSMEALDMFLRYNEVISSVQGKLERTFSAYESIGDILQMTSNRDELLAKEQAESKEVLEATISAYNEFRLAYPMHKKYQQTINLLLDYKDDLKEVRRNLESFPLKFIDATSAYCN